MKNIKVLVIDDSAVVRQVLSGIINKAEGMEVIDVAIDPIFALKKLATIKPDVITLDIEMPRMDGLTFLEKLMRENPVPVVMCSTLTQKSADISLKALNLGAVEIVAKPITNVKKDLTQKEKVIIDAIRAAAKVNLENLIFKSADKRLQPGSRDRHSADVILPKEMNGQSTLSSKLIAIGASTGGTQALEYVISRLNPDTAGVVVVQHMPEAFTNAFARRLDSISQVTVKEAVEGDTVEPGKVLIAPGGKHMMVENRTGNLIVTVRSGPLVSRHCPSVDVLFRSAAQSASHHSLGIIMTGMGDDGAIGMKEMFDNGAFTMAQDKESCVIFGMPAKAIERGGVKTSCPLEHIPRMINAFNRPMDFNALIELNRRNLRH